MRSPLLCVLVLIAMAGGARAEPSIERGRAVAIGVADRPAPGAACLTCHGLDGAGDSAGAFPRLSGQAPWYLYKQLQDFASGRRPSDVMTPIAAALTQSEMEDVAAYYAAQAGQIFARGTISDPAALQVGASIAAAGLGAEGVQSCANCHGDAGRGLPPSFPYLAGQYAPYLQLQLQLFKTSDRANDPLAVMREIASRLSDEQIEALALYFDSLMPPDETQAEADQAQ